jgi:hypothetical protein
MIRCLIYLYLLILIYSSLVAIKNHCKLSGAIKYFGILVLITLAFELFAFYYACSRSNNIFIYVVLMPVRVFLINLAHYKYHENALFKKTSILLLVFYLIYYTNFVCNMSFMVFPNKLIMIENLVSYAIVIHSSYLIIVNGDYSSLKRNSFLWINLGYLFYLSTTFVIWGFHYVFKTNDVNLISRSALTISNIILYLTIGISLLKFRVNNELA